MLIGRLEQRVPIAEEAYGWAHQRSDDLTPRWMIRAMGIYEPC